MKRPRRTRSEEGLFGTILVDPPWDFRVWSDKGAGRCAAANYKVQPDQWIIDLGERVRRVAKANCMLLLWIVNSHLIPTGEDVIESWGFEYVTKLTWVKTTLAGAVKIGLGYQQRTCSEDLLICRRGKVPAPSPDRRPEGVIFNGIGEHSAKPDIQYQIAENYPGPYLEMFHRPAGPLFPGREGWTFLGNEATGRDITEDLDLLIERKWTPNAAYMLQGTPFQP